MFKWDSVVWYHGVKKLFWGSQCCYYLCTHTWDPFCKSCGFILYRMGRIITTLRWLKWKWKSLSPVRHFATRGLQNPWNFLSQNTGIGSLSLLQGIFPTQGWNSGLLHCRRILYQPRHKGSPALIEPLQQLKYFCKRMCRL